ncbi:MAG TPA: hypothetical protein VLV56_14525 [Burkholderiales bacterium]|nr:hypothetical protein [Burkholderiales bacterium]
MRLLILAFAAPFALSACQGKTDPPGEAPSNVRAVPGDGLAVVSWDMLPDLTYWIFYQPGSTVDVATPNSIAIRRTFSPRVVANLANDTQYAFVMNATHDDSSAGPNSLPVLATPKLAGPSWSPGTALGTPPQNLKSLVLGGGRFVAVGDAATIFAGDFNYTSNSPNPGVTQWTQIPAAQLPQGFTADLSCVIFNGTFIALGTDGSIIASTDGLNWSKGGTSVPGSGMNGLAFGVVFGTSTFVAVGNGGQIFTTTDLNQWHQAGVGITTSDLTSVSVLNQGFVATGTNGTLLTSPTGGVNDWTQIPLNPNTTNTLRSAVYTPFTPNVHYVAVGDAGTIVVSTVFTDWTVITSPLTQDLRSVTVGGASASRILAVGQGGAVVYSDDGVAGTWQTAPPPGSSNNLASVLFSSGLYLGVGDAGANVVSR